MNGFERVGEMQRYNGGLRDATSTTRGMWEGAGRGKGARFCTGGGGVWRVSESVKD